MEVGRAGGPGWRSRHGCMTRTVIFLFLLLHVFFSFRFLLDFCFISVRSIDHMDVLVDMVTCATIL